MNNANERLAKALMEALAAAGVVNGKEGAALKTRILAGGIKPEDWYFAVEKSLEAPTRDDSHEP